MNTPRRSFIATALASLATVFGFRSTAEAREVIFPAIKNASPENVSMDFHFSVERISDSDPHRYRAVFMTRTKEGLLQRTALESKDTPSDNDQDERMFFFQCIAYMLRQKHATEFGLAIETCDCVDGKLHIKTDS